MPSIGGTAFGEALSSRYARCLTRLEESSWRDERTHLAAYAGALRTEILRPYATTHVACSRYPLVVSNCGQNDRTTLTEDGGYPTPCSDRTDLSRWRRHP